MDPTFEQFLNGIRQILKEAHDQSGELSNEDEEYLKILADTKKHLENLQETVECDNTATLKNICQAVLYRDYIIVRNNFTVFSLKVEEAESIHIAEKLQPGIKRIKDHLAKLSELIKNMDNLAKKIRNKVDDFFERNSKLTEEERLEVEFLNIDFETVVKQTTDYFNQADRELKMFESDLVSYKKGIINKPSVYGAFAPLAGAAMGGVLGGVFGAALGAVGGSFVETVVNAEDAAEAPGGVSTSGFLVVDYFSYSSQCKKINDKCEELNSELAGLAGADVGLARAVAAAGVVPSEINLRGPLALEAYNKALTEGKACIKRVPVMLIGQDHSGKTSLKNSLMGKPFNEDEDSTVGIDVDPSYFKVSSEIWRPGETDQATNGIEATSFEQHAARLVAGELQKEKRDTKSMRSENSASELPVDSRKSAPSSETSIDATESIHTSKDLQVDVRKLVPKTSSSSTQGRKEHSLLALPKIPDETAILIKKLIKEVEKVQDDDEIYSVLWDFGGQSVYYATHPLFITTRAMYLLVYDLSLDPHAMAEPVVKQGKYRKILDNHGAKSNLDYLKFWMTSVASLASQDEDQHVRSGRVQVNIPPVFLVCTHADEPYGGTNPLDLAREILGYLKTKPYRNQLYKDVFVVNNKMSGTESECPEVIRLRENVLAVAKELPQLKESIPIKWLKYEKALQVTVKEGHKWISFKKAQQIASEVCQIEDDKEFSTLLNFLHDQRILIHFDDTQVLNDLVVLDPQWLVDVFKMVITVAPYDQQEAEFEELWCRLESKGILDEKLLEHVWGSLLDKQKTFASLTEIMEKFSLLCPLPSSDASCGKQYLVPSMLNCHPPEGTIQLVDSAQIPSLFFKFESGQVPPGLFPRLVLQFFHWGQDEFWSSENPDLYHSFARFYTSADDDCSVILLCHSSSIEVAVHRGNISADVTESLQPKLNISVNFNCDVFEMACACAVRKKLGLMLECMREEFRWLKNMEYEVGVICPICCQGRVAKYNCMHSKRGCEQEECLHFWSESELRSVKHSIRCCRLATAQINKVPVNQIAPWIETPGEQLTIVERDGRLLTREEENDEKLLALPSKDLKSLLSQPCDSKEIVLQLKDCLHLDQASMEQPDPGTQRLIRCLARKAKQSNRLDVFKHLREITPAGTTGPVLPECRDIRQIPFDQMRELTVTLSGGDEWKVLAAELGLKQHEIRYLDSHRILNPCEALLTYIANQGNISVGYLYNKLIKCKLPVVADLL